MRTTALLAFLASVWAAVFVCRPARATGEDEWQLSLRVGAGSVNVDGRNPWGFALALDGEYGLTDAWAVRATVARGLYPVSADAATGRPGGLVSGDAALVGVTYTIDVLRLVPYADLELGAFRLGGAVSRPDTRAAAELGLGADYFVTRRWIAGVSFQYLYAPTNLASNPVNLGSSPFAFLATLKVSRTF